MYNHNKIIIGVSLLLAHASSFCMLSPDDRQKTADRIEKATWEQSLDYGKSFAIPTVLYGLGTYTALKNLPSSWGEGSRTICSFMTFGSFLYAEYRVLGGKDDQNTKSRNFGRIVGLITGILSSGKLPIPAGSASTVNDFEANASIVNDFMKK